MYNDRIWKNVKVLNSCSLKSEITRIFKNVLNVMTKTIYWSYERKICQSSMKEHFEHSIKLGYVPFISCSEFTSLEGLLLTLHHHHHHHVPEGLGVLSCSLTLKMKLVPPPLPWSSRVPSSFWFIL